MSHAHQPDSAATPAPAGPRPAPEPGSGATVAASAGASPAPPSPVSHPEEATLGTLVSQLSAQVPELVRSELRLAQLELADKGKRAGIGAGMFGAAGVVALFGMGALVTTAILLLDLVLPAWLAALIVAVVLFAVAGVAALLGRKKLAEASPPRPERAMANVKEDIATVKGDRR